MKDDFEIVFDQWPKLKEEYFQFPLVASIFRRSLLEDRLSKINADSITGVNRVKEIEYRWKKKLKSRVSILNILSPRKLALYSSLFVKILSIHLFNTHSFSVISYIHKTPCLENSFKEFLNENLKVKTFYFEKSFISFLSSIILSLSLSKKLHNNIIESGVQAVLSSKNDQELYSLENRLIKTIIFVKKIFKILQIKIIFTHDSHSQVGMIIATAAKELKIKIIEVSHGYTQDESLLTIFPLYADYEIVWSDNVQSMIKKKFSGTYLEKFYFHKIVSFSQPVSIVNKNKPGNYTIIKKNILVIIPSIKSFNDDLKAQTFNNFKKLIKSLISKKYKVYFRPHPSDFNLVTSNEFFINFKSYCIFDLKKSASLENYNIVLGGMSSLLFEAASMGLFTFQITEYPGVMIEGATPVNFRNCLEKIENMNLRPRNKIDSFRIDKFHNFLFSIGINSKQL